MEIYQLIYLQRCLGSVAKRMPYITELNGKKQFKFVQKQNKHLLLIPKYLMQSSQEKTYHTKRIAEFQLGLGIPGSWDPEIPGFPGF